MYVGAAKLAKQVTKLQQFQYQYGPPPPSPRARARRPCNEAWLASRLLHMHEEGSLVVCKIIQQKPL